MTAPERAYLKAMADLNHRSAARISTYLKRPDLGPALRDVAWRQREEYAEEARRLEAQIADARWPLGVLDSPAATDRLTRAQADLSEVRAELVSDQRRSNLRAAHRAQGIAQTARIREYAAASRVDPMELVNMAPSLAAEMAERMEA